MNYKLIKNSLNDINNPQKTILLNRGISDYKTFLNLNEDCVYDYNLLDNMQQAVECYLKHINNNSNIHILCDCDTDGYTSASAIYLFTKKTAPNINLTYSIHSKKEHGLSKDIQVPDETQLLIIPDASSNDVEQCKKLSEKGIEIIILDHHECDVDNKYAIVVNNQMCGYPNKELSGVGIVYKFMQAVDNETWNDYADDFLDLVSLGLVADSMDVKSFETRYLIDKGLNKIRNKFIKAMIDKQSYTMGVNFTSKDIQFCIVPMINGMIRAGDYDEKDLMFHAFIETDEMFKYKKRGSDEETDETIYDRVARLCGNARARQNKSKDNSLSKIYVDIENHKFDENKIVFANVTKVLNETMTGVVAIKVAEHYNKPCLLLRKKEIKPLHFTIKERKSKLKLPHIKGKYQTLLKVKKKKCLYGGSGRNLDSSPIENLKDFLNDLHIFNFVQGHQGAFGFEIEKNKIQLAIEAINNKLKDVDFNVHVYVDFAINGEQLDIGLIKNLDSLKRYYGTGFKEPVIAVENLIVNKNQFILMGKENSSWKVITDEGVALVKFKIGDDDLLKQAFEEHETVELTIVGTPNINNYKGILTSQIIIKEYEIIEVN